jgi:hypothetical protein
MRSSASHTGDLAERNDRVAEVADLVSDDGVVEAVVPVARQLADSVVAVESAGALGQIRKRVADHVFGIERQQGLDSPRDPGVGCLAHQLHVLLRHRPRIISLD